MINTRDLRIRAFIAYDFQTSTRFPFLAKSGFILRVFWSSRGAQTRQDAPKTHEVVFKMFLEGCCSVGVQVGAKLGPSWLQNAPKFEKYRKFGGSDLNFFF